ncbi:MAG: hypothetical protein DRI44_02195 [Chlamydiae bacterium]|nr:MAG: hypothetical protein DRI44_02195 [Chlamydiota bacterium]
MKIKMKKILMPALALMVIASLISCSKKVEEKKEQVWNVKIMTIGSNTTSVNYDYPGQVKATDSADLSFVVAGRVLELPIKQGEVLKKGDIVAKLDQRDFIANLKSAKAEYDLAKSQYDSYQKLVDKGVISKDEFNQKKRNLDVALSDVRTAEKALEDSVLKAPFNGSVGRKYIDNHQDVAVNQPVIQLQNLVNLDILINIPENDVARGKGRDTIEDLAKKIKAEVAFASIPNKKYRVTLKEFGTIADSDTQTYPITFTMKRPNDANIMPGMTATISILPSSLSGEIERKSSAIFVPINSVISEPNGTPFVWVVDPSTMTVQKREVKVGEMKDGKMEINSGLKKDEQIVVSGTMALSPGAKVKKYKKFF